MPLDFDKIGAELTAGAVGEFDDAADLTGQA
jgi:hypothetical protein